MTTSPIIGHAAVYEDKGVTHIQSASVDVESLAIAKRDTTRLTPAFSNIRVAAIVDIPDHDVLYAVMWRSERRPAWGIASPGTMYRVEAEADRVRDGNRDMVAAGVLSGEYRTAVFLIPKEGA